MADYTLKAEPEVKPLRCAANGCKETPRYKVSLILRATKGGVAANGMSNLLVCEHHKDIKIMEIFPTAESWRKIETRFISAGYHPPKRQYSEVKLIKL